MQFIELIEGQERQLPQGELDQDLAMAIYRSGKFEFGFPSPINEFQYTINSKNLIGHVAITPECLVRVLPKVPVLNLFCMLEVAYNLKSFQLLPGTTHIERLDDLFDRLASILARRVLDRARKGLYRDYLNEHDNLAYVRGRIDIERTTRLLISGSASLNCIYQDHTADLTENQILLWTLRIISRLGIRRPEVISEVRHARRVLTGLVSARPVTATECLGRFYHRLNQDYQPMHGICRFFLEHAGPGIKEGEHELIPFTLDMPKLFETFVAEWLRADGSEEFIVRPQHIAKLEANETLSFQIDVVLKDPNSGKTLAVLDTKYKSVETPSEADIQQVVAYAVEMGTSRAFLVYPSQYIKPIQARVGHVEVRSLAFDLGEDYDEEGKRFLNGLREAIKPVVVE